MASTTPNIILLEVNGAERPIYEKPSSAAVTPGTFLAEGATTVAENGTAKANILLALAVENPYAPVPTTAAIDQDYASGDTVRFVYPQRGDKALAWLKSGANVAFGAKLELATAGQLQAFTDGTVVAIAYEAKDASAAEKRIRVRFI